MYIYIYIYIYICRHVFCPSQDSSVWLESTSREQLMSPECSNQGAELHQIAIYIYGLRVDREGWWFEHSMS